MNPKLIDNIKINNFYILNLIVLYCLLHLKACASDLPGYKVVQANHWYGTQRFNITKNLIRIDNSYGHMLLSTNDELVTIYNDKTKKIAFLKPVELADSARQLN